MDLLGMSSSAITGTAKTSDNKRLDDDFEVDQIVMKLATEKIKDAVEKYN